MQNGQLFEGKYSIIREIGHGGMSTVYLAENIKLGTLWAIKVISKNNKERLDLLAEPNILKNLNHPLLPRIFDVFEDEENYYVVSDYIEGSTLDKKLQQDGSFEEEVVKDWAIQLAEALDYLHLQKPNPVIYRDMKPSNIMVQKDGTLKLIDFGIAREYKKGTANDTVFIGTKGYAPPEQYGLGQTGAASDIYSLGVTIHQLLTGKDPNIPPYEIKAINSYGKSFSGSFERIIARCTRFEAALRYQTARDLINELDKLNSPTRNADVTGSLTQPPPSASRKLIITIWGNSEFGCEFAYTVAKITGLQVLLADIELLSPKADLYLNISKYPERVICEGLTNQSGLSIVMDSIERNYYSSAIFKDASVIRPETKNLHILTGNYKVDNYEYYNDEYFETLIEKAYTSYDIIFLLASKSIYDSYTIISLIKSDFNIIPIDASVDCLREFNSYIAFLEEKQNISASKNKFVAFQYDPAVNLSESTLQQLTYGNYAGSISYNARRVKLRNMRIPYAKRIEKENLAQYIKLMEYFSIVPKSKLKDKIMSQLTQMPNFLKARG